MQTLLVNKTDFGDVALVNYDEASLPDGQIRVDIGPFALTANNVTSVSYTHLTLPTIYSV